MYQKYHQEKENKNWVLMRSSHSKENKRDIITSPRTSPRNFVCNCCSYLDVRKQKQSATILDLDT